MTKVANATDINYLLCLLLLNEVKFNYLVTPVVILKLVFKWHTEIPMIETIDETFLVHGE